MNKQGFWTRSIRLTWYRVVVPTSSTLGKRALLVALVFYEDVSRASESASRSWMHGAGVYRRRDMMGNAKPLCLRILYSDNKESSNSESSSAEPRMAGAPSQFISQVLSFYPSIATYSPSGYDQIYTIRIPSWARSKRPVPPSWDRCKEPVRPSRDRCKEPVRPDSTVAVTGDGEVPVTLRTNDDPGSFLLSRCHVVLWRIQHEVGCILVSDDPSSTVTLNPRTIWVPNTLAHPSHHLIHLQKHRTRDGVLEVRPPPEQLKSNVQRSTVNSKKPPDPVATLESTRSWSIFSKTDVRFPISVVPNSIVRSMLVGLGGLKLVLAVRDVFLSLFCGKSLVGINVCSQLHSELGLGLGVPVPEQTTTMTPSSTSDQNLDADVSPARSAIRFIASLVRLSVAEMFVTHERELVLSS
ncbi:hypothetical protein K474DRAFT_1676403 [Panus rudis PR-1116 ss-1]|nr:hypothetical protein K474DRAFT_1676403 [Panus rudis PR-1116 ss-1]